MRLEAGCEITFDVAAPTPLVLILRPRSGYGQWIAQESYDRSPVVPVVEYVDSYGNLCQRLVAPPGRFVVKASAHVETADMIDSAPGAPFMPIQELPDSVLQFLLPSRYCQSDLLSELAGQIVQGATLGYDQVEAIRHWIQTNVEYRYGTSEECTARYLFIICRNKPAWEVETNATANKRYMVGLLWPPTL